MQEYNGGAAAILPLKRTCSGAARVCVQQYHLTTHFELDALTHYVAALLLSCV
jgi:hypothetical protein